MFGIRFRAPVIEFLRRNRAVLVLAFVVALTSSGTAAAVSFALGVTNTASKTTTLKSAVNGSVLQVTNTNGTGGSAARGVSITVPAGRAPLTVNPTAGKATNLDADKLDGQDGAAYQLRLTSLEDLDGIGCALKSHPDALLLVLGAEMDCVTENTALTEPNETEAQAIDVGAGTDLGKSITSLVGPTDVDWFRVTDACNDTTCLISAQLGGKGVTMDLYKNGTKVQSGVTSIVVFENYAGSTPVYEVRLFAASRLPYRLGFQ